MPVEFRLEPTGSSSDTLFRLLMEYDGSGRRISKTVMHKVAGAADWETAQVTHYTGIGTEVRENFAGPIKETKVVVNMPQGLGRYGIEEAEKPDFDGMTGNGLVGYIPNAKFEWYLKNHLGSTMLVYGTVASTNPNEADVGEKIAAYDYHSFGEMVELTPPATDKVTENFTGSRFARRTQRTACKSIAEPKNLGAKRNEHDDEIALDYFGARYLDPMLGMWTSVDPARQFASPYLYAGNGMNPIIGSDSDGNWFNPFGCLVAVGVGLVESWNAQAEYRRISGENYSPLTEAIIGASVYLGYVAAGSFSYGANILESGIISGLWGGTLSGGAVAVVQGVGTGSLDGIDGNQVRDSFTKGAISSMVGTFVGAGATEMMGGTLSEIYGVPSGQEVVGGAIGGIAGFLFDKNATLVPPPDQRNSAE